MIAAMALPMHATTLNVLWYFEPGPGSFRNSIDALAAANGWNVTFFGNAADPTPNFSDYNVMVTESFGFSATYSTLLADDSAIEAARGSRTVITGQELDFMYIQNSLTAAGTFLTNAVNWAGAGTGLGVVALPDADKWWENANSFLAGDLGTSPLYVSGDSVTDTVPSHPVNNGLTSASLSGWDLSYFNLFHNVPAGYQAITNSGAVDFRADAVTIVQDTATPEPATTGLLVAGFGTMLVAIRRRRAV